MNQYLEPRNGRQFFVKAGGTSAGHFEKEGIVPFDVEPCLAIICDLNLSTIFTKTSVKLQKHIPPLSGY